MTREEALKVLDTIPTIGEQVDALEMAIKALEQEPCEDCISRQAVIDEMGDTNMDIYTEEVKDFVRSLPPVTPQPKIGRWIVTAEEYYKAINNRGGGVNENTDYFVDDIACSECLIKFSTIDNETEFFNHCPNCGARMEVEE